MNWVSLLSLIQIIYNSSVNVTTEQTSFFTNHSYNVNLFLTLKKVKIWVEKVDMNAKELYKMHQELKTDIEFLVYRLVFYHNKHHAEALILKKKNKVYLL